MSYRKVVGLEGLLGSADVMDESEFVCPTLWGLLATLGAELTLMKRLSLTPPPPVDFDSIRAEFKETQDTLAGSMTKLEDLSLGYSPRL
jgi:hypothetical protein